MPSQVESHVGDALASTNLPPLILGQHALDIDVVVVQELAESLWELTLSEISEMRALHSLSNGFGFGQPERMQWQRNKRMKGSPQIMSASKSMSKRSSGGSSASWSSSGSNSNGNPMNYENIVRGVEELYVKRHSHYFKHCSNIVARISQSLLTLCIYKQDLELASVVLQQTAKCGSDSKLVPWTSVQQLILLGAKNDEWKQVMEEFLSSMKKKV